MRASPNRKDGRLGRIILLVGAYAPAAIIVGFRVGFELGGYIAIGIGVLGVLAWVALLQIWLPHHAHPRAVVLKTVEPLDTEVTAYIASYLLPIVAAGSPGTGDWFAYGLCAVLILIVAYGADLGSVNPIVYLFGLRVARAEIDGQSIFLLVDRIPPPESSATIARTAGVALVLKQE
jgi:hypothetical protein